MERRKGRRYSLSAPAFCWWKHADGESRVTQCTTRDLSHRGAFIFSALLPSPGAYVEVDVYLPSLTMSRSVHLHGEGRVLRTRQAGTDPSGFAAEVQFQTENSDDSIILGPERIQ